jgi:transcription antitermination factor NusA-like protein
LNPRKLFNPPTEKSQGVANVEEKTLNQLKQMLNVKIDRVEEQGEQLVVYVPKDQVAKAIGAGGCVVRSVERVLNRKLSIKEST